MTDFIAVDVETANADIASICSIGLVHFRDGNVFRNLSTLVDPQTKFDPANIAVHGIRPEAVRGAPTMEYLYPVLQKHLQNLVLVHHTHFDRSAFRRVAETLGAAELSCSWLDSARVTRIAWPKYRKRGYGLANVCYDFRIEFKHHDASEDARAAGLVLCRAMADTGIPLRDWIDRVNLPISGGGGQRLTATERTQVNPDGPLFGEVICFTGTLSLPRETAQRMALDAGCRVMTSVSTKTTLVVIGEDEAGKPEDQRSGKHKAARAVREAGHELRFLSERDFRLLVGAI